MDHKIPNVTQVIQKISENGPTDDKGNPLILPFSQSKKRVVYLDYILHRKPRAYKRLGAYGAVVLSNRYGQIVAAGKMRDISENNVGLLARDSEIKPNDVLFIEFLNHSMLGLNQMKVVVKRVQEVGHSNVIGVEFLSLTKVFQSRLDQFLEEMRNDKSGFGFNEII